MIARLAAIVLLALAAAAPQGDAFRVVDQDGRAVDFYRDVIGDRAAAINFVFTSCTAVCPLLGANFAAVQRELAGAKIDDVALISISVDPETDTPARLKAWRDARGGKAGWTLLTGGRREITALLAHLGASTPSPASHTSSILVGRRGAWGRLDGLAAPHDVVARLREERGAGASIFLEGTRAGRAIPAALATGVALTPAAAACANCHGRDGRGRTEAGRAVPDIRWARLTAPYGVSRPYGRTVDPYTEATLLRALAEGVDSAGQPLDAAMPRYRIDAAGAAALVAHLRSLDERRERGVSDDAVALGLAGIDPRDISSERIFGRAISWQPLARATMKRDAASVLAIAARVDAGSLASLEAFAASEGVPIVAAVAGEPPARVPASGNLIVMTPSRDAHARALVDAIVKLPGGIAIAGGDRDWRETAAAVRAQLRQWGSATQPAGRAKHVIHLAPMREIARTVAEYPGARVYTLGDPGPGHRGVACVRAEEDGAAAARVLVEVLRRAGRDLTRDVFMTELARVTSRVSTGLRLCYSPGSDSNDPC